MLVKRLVQTGLKRYEKLKEFVVLGLKQESLNESPCRHYFKEVMYIVKTGFKEKLFVYLLFQGDW